MYRDLKFTARERGRGSFKQTSSGADFPYSGRARWRRAYQAPHTRRPGYIHNVTPFIPGVNRTAGYYGRFTGKGATELKFHDLDINDADVAIGGTVIAQSINLIAQGVTEVQRVGRKCVIRHIGWKFDVTIPVDNGAGGEVGDVVRILLYLDKQCNGAPAALDDLIETDSYQSFNNLSNKSRFRTLMDRTYQLSYPGGAGNGTANDWNEQTIVDSFYKKVNIPIEFDGTTGAITEIKSNNIGVLILGKHGNAELQSKMRVRFSDN